MSDRFWKGLAIGSVVSLLLWIAIIMLTVAAIGVDLITLHMIDGRVVQLNPEQITQVIHPREAGKRALVEGVNCVVRLTDGSFVSAAETCEAVQKALEGLKQ